MESQKPLRNRQDVQELQLGKESTAKVAEIVESGSLYRNKAFLADPKAQTIALVIPASLHQEVLLVQLKMGS